MFMAAGSFVSILWCQFWPSEERILDVYGITATQLFVAWCLRARVSDHRGRTSCSAPESTKRLVVPTSIPWFSSGSWSDNLAVEITGSKQLFRLAAPLCSLSLCPLASLSFLKIVVPTSVNVAFLTCVQVLYVRVLHVESTSPSVFTTSSGASRWVFRTGTAFCCKHSFGLLFVMVFVFRVLYLFREGSVVLSRPRLRTTSWTSCTMSTSSGSCWLTDRMPPLGLSFSCDFEGAVHDCCVVKLISRTGNVVLGPLKSVLGFESSQDRARA